MNLEHASIPPSDVTYLQTILDAWCRHQNIRRQDANEEAKILISEYNKGTRSQISLIDALIKRH